MKHLVFFAILLVSVSVSSCKRSNDRNLDYALSIADSNPDSTLLVLATIDKRVLNKRDLAKFSLAYYWALDRIGYDVDNDSLIRNAYKYYQTQKESRYYGRAMYYMGKFYFLVDSIERAERCFEEAIISANKIYDIKTECLATEKLSRCVRYQDLNKSEELASRVTALLLSSESIDTINLIYAKINEIACAAYNQHFEKAKKIGNEALALSKIMDIPFIISDVHQNLSFIYRCKGTIDSALFHSRKAFDYKENFDFSLGIALANDYVNMDSIIQAKEVLNKLNTGGNYKKMYAKSYAFMKAAILNNNKEESLIYADSAFNAIESLYLNTLSEKRDYYNDLLEETHDKARLEGRESMKTTVLSLILLSLLIVIIYIIHVHYLTKKNTAMLIKAEKEKKELEIAYKEAQISKMRDYIYTKIGIIEKIEQVKKNPKKQIKLSDEDWKEIELFLETTNNAFASRIRDQFKNLTEDDIRLLFLLRLKLSAKSLSVLYNNISDTSIKHKLLLFKPKVGLKKDDMSLRTFIENF